MDVEGPIYYEIVLHLSGILLFIKDIRIFNTSLIYLLINIVEKIINKHKILCLLLRTVDSSPHFTLN